MKAQPNFVSVADAAAIMGLHPRYVRKLCAAGKIEALRVGKVFLVVRQAASAYERDPYGRGRPKGKA
jgi:excisionase family DNA binding protein